MKDKDISIDMVWQYCADLFLQLFDLWLPIKK